MEFRFLVSSSSEESEEAMPVGFILLWAGIDKWICFILWLHEFYEFFGRYRGEINWNQVITCYQLNFS
jgi:hypothetical protein